MSSVIGPKLNMPLSYRRFLGGLSASRLEPSLRGIKSGSFGGSMSFPRRILWSLDTTDNFPAPLGGSFMLNTSVDLGMKPASETNSILSRLRPYVFLDTGTLMANAPKNVDEIVSNLMVTGGVGLRIQLAGESGVQVVAAFPSKLAAYSQRFQFGFTLTN